MTNKAIEVHNIGKKYHIGTADTQVDTLAATVMNGFRSPLRRVRDLLRGNAGGANDLTQEFWAVQDVSFDVAHGEVVGIIGRNGAGKSTLLKILSRITTPTEGYAKVHGRVGSLLEVGTGFHQELTGRENVFLNGSILGMRRQEIAQKFDDIVDFAGVSQFIDTPVKHYSSGMRVRLGFAVAAFLEPEILVIDEVLSVGDAEFQKRSLGKMGEVSKSGRTVLFVSHNMAAVENLCSRGIVLEKGRMRFDGDASETVQEYLRNRDTLGVDLRDRTDREGSGEIRVTNISLRDKNGHPIDIVSSGQALDIVLEYEMTQPYERTDIITSLLVRTNLGTNLSLHHNRLAGVEYTHLPEKGQFILRIPKLPLNAGNFSLSYSLMHLSGYGGYIDRLEDAFELTVSEGDFFGSGEIPPSSHGVLLMDGTWLVEERNKEFSS
jgi:lipopolysaccharide transport system ATP-binding protein